MVTLEVSPEIQICPPPQESQAEWAGRGGPGHGGLPVAILPPAVPRVGHSEGSRRASVERRSLLPLKSHYQQRKSAQGASDRAFPPNTESFPIPQGLPALSRTPRTQGQCKKERTKGTLSPTGVAHSDQQQRSTSLESTFGWVHSPGKDPGLFHLAPGEAEIKRERVLGNQVD